jgi:hypothetical protein
VTENNPKIIYDSILGCDLGLRSARRSQCMALRTRASLTVVSRSAIHTAAVA